MRQAVVPIRALGPALLLLPVMSVEAQAPRIFHAETNLVVLHATVKNAHGELVTDLGQEAFTVYDNGRRQKIEMFRREDIPVSLGLLIDNSGSMRALRAKVEAAALACVRASHPQDEVFVLNFGDKPQLDVPLTSDVRLLEAGITRVDSIGGTAMRDAVDVGTGYLASSATKERKVLLVITDGKDNASLASLDAIRKQAQQREITVYAIGLFNQDGQAGAGGARDELNELTDSTGGAAHYPSSLEDIDAVALAIAREIRNQYTIAFNRTDRLDGSYRKLRVDVRGRGRLVVRARAGYWATPALP
ncbi:MAG TPA: VWA domain-containing protein [Vicinamibacterales bacterium]